MKHEPQDCVWADLCCTGCSGHRLLERILAIPDLASMGGRLRLQQLTPGVMLETTMLCWTPAPREVGTWSWQVGMPQQCWGSSM